MYTCRGCQEDPIPSGSYEYLQACCAQLEAKVVKLEEDNGCMRKQILLEDLLVGKDNLTDFILVFPPITHSNHLLITLNQKLRD